MHTKVNLGNFIPLLAIPAVLVFPQGGQLISPATFYLLGALLFFSFLGLGLERVLMMLRAPKETFYVSLVVLVLTPLVIYPVMERFFPEYLLGAFIFMLLPAALSSPAVAAIYGGNVEKAAVNTITSNLLSPFTITLFLGVFAATSVSVPLSRILGQLLMLVLIPFVAALFCNRYAPQEVSRIRPHLRLINLALLFLFFFAALAPYHQSIWDHALDDRLWLAVLVTHIVLYVFAKLAVLHERIASDRIAIESNLFFLNVGLGVFIAQKFFGPTEMLFIIFCEIVWVVLVSIFKYFR